MKRNPLMLVVLLLVLSLVGFGQTGGLSPTVLLISLDGFRYDYVDRGYSPNLASLAAQGVRAKEMVPIFPTKTFVNHYTQVTGLYPSKSGIVSNTMHDKSNDAWFRISDATAVTTDSWWKGEPIWSTAVKQGQRAACYFWPGSEAEIAGVRPTVYKKFDGRVPHAERVRDVLAWLNLPAEDRPTMITLYFSDTDGAGHRFGPESPEVNNAIAKLDTTLGTLFDGLRTRGIFDEINILVVSDHGMSQLDPKRVLFWDDIQDPQTVTVVDEGPVLSLDVPDDSVAVVASRIRSLGPNIRVLSDEDLSKDFHIDRSPRVPSVFAVADDGWMVLRRSRMNRPVSGGSHGYDHRAKSMQSTFIAHGPAFKSGAVVESVRTIDLYELMAHILKLTPATNDGSLDGMKPILK